MSQSNSSFLATFATLDALESLRIELLEGRAVLYEWFERCKRDVGRNYERACGKGAVACARFVEKLAEDSDPKVVHGTLRFGIQFLIIIIMLLQSLYIKCFL